MSLAPVVREMIVCDEVHQDPANPAKMSVAGLIHAILMPPGGRFPLVHPALCVYLQLTGGSGTGRVQVTVADADTDETLFGSGEHPFSFPRDRTALLPLLIRLRDCRFPKAGLYWIQFCYDGRVAASKPLLVR